MGRGLPQTRRDFIRSTMATSVIALSPNVFPYSTAAAAVPSESGSYAGCISMMYKLIPETVGPQLFDHVPPCLRASFLEILSVQNGLRAAGMISLFPEDLRSAIGFLKATELHVVIAPSRAQESRSFAQLSPQLRAEFQKRASLRVYFARDKALARELLRIEKAREMGRAEIGPLLGYPACCVEAASERDEITDCNAFDVLRQTNLTSSALHASSGLHYTCNTFLRESTLAAYGPTALVFHYPCTFECEASQSIGSKALDLLRDTSPLWALNLIELLKAPVAYWPDDDWEPSYWQEYCGICFLEGRFVSDRQIHATRQAVITGSSEIPGGELPTDTWALIVDQHQTRLRGLGDSDCCLAHSNVGEPTLLDWRGGSIRSRPSSQTA